MTCPHCGAFLASGAQPSNSRGIARQIDGHDDVVLRSGPGKKKAQVAHIPNETVVDMLGEENGYTSIRVVHTPSTTGWARTNNLIPITANLRTENSLPIQDVEMTGNITA